MNWYYVNSNGGKKQFFLDQSDKKRLYNKLINILKKIEKSESENLFPAKESLLCNWCYYWDKCDAKIDLNEKNLAKNLK